MKLKLATLLLLVAPVLPVQFVVNSAATTKRVSVVVTAPVGSTLATFCANTSDAQAQATSSDGATFRPINFHDDGFLAGSWFAATVVAANPTVTCTYTAQVNTAAVFVYPLAGYQAVDGQSSQTGLSSSPQVSYRPGQAVETVLAVAVCSSACPAMWSNSKDATGDGATSGTVQNGSDTNWNGQALLFTGAPTTWLASAVGFYATSAPTVVSMGVRFSYTDAAGVAHTFDIAPGANSFQISALLNMSDGSQVITPTAQAGLTVTQP